MANSNLLQSETVSFLELIGNGKSFVVPAYQRDYSWTTEQWEDLWQDIREIHGVSGESHYLGSIVLAAKSDREFTIIDGQQRIATLSIIVLVVIHQLKELAEGGIEPEKNTQRAQELRNRYIGEKDPATLLEISKLRLNQNDDGFYSDRLVQLDTQDSKSIRIHSNRLLNECFKFYSSQIKHLDFADDGLRLAQLVTETIARKLLFVRIKVDDEVNAYTVFETMNARGLELTATDLLKNHLFSRVNAKSDLDALKRRWKALLEHVSAERFAEFLRYHIMTEGSEVSKRSLYKRLRRTVSSATETFELVRALESRAPLYEALSDPESGFWTGSLADARSIIKALTLFGARQFIPLAFAARERLDDADFTRVLKLIEVVTFRYSKVGSLNPNLLETAYSGVAGILLEGKISTPRQVFELLDQKGVYVSDKKFQQDFAELRLSERKGKLAIHILCQIERSLSGQVDTTDASLEHILPASPSADWEPHIPVSHWNEYAYRLGNLALLEQSLNRTVGNQPFSEKLSTYQRSRFLTTLEIPAKYKQDWTRHTIEERQQWLAEQARKIWRADFSQ